MARNRSRVEINNFTRGLITEANPLTYPENASLDEQNFELRTDGSRDRRLGMDYESGYQIRNSTNAIPSVGDLAVQCFVWENAGGDPEQELLVVQIGNKLSFYDNTLDAVSPNLIQVGSPLADEYEVVSASNTATYGMASVDGILVVASGNADVLRFEYDGTSVSDAAYRIKTRDLFGVEDIDPHTGRDLYSPEYVAYRPALPLSDEHTYNATNQGWGINIANYTTSSVGSMPIARVGRVSNADTPYPGVLYNNGTPPFRGFDSGRWAVDRFRTFAAPKGFYIIDALERGSSRLEQFNATKAITAGTGFPTIATLPADRTPGGAKVTAEFSGRIFYAGFSGDVLSGDALSPRLSSYVFFSQLVKTPSDLGRCYQEGDPTSDVESDIVATDGGFIKIQGAYGISRLINIGDSLIVLAENGVWAIRGESGVGFSATRYEVIKVSEQGCDSPQSAVVVDNTVMYWSESGIYHITRDQTGALSIANLTSKTIQSFYDDISTPSKRLAIGAFDSYSRRVRWLYNNTFTADNPSSELVLDLNLQAFYPSVINESEAGRPILAAPFNSPPYSTGTSVEDVVVLGDPVEVLTEQVTVNRTVRENALKEIKYLCLTSDNPIQYTFSQYRDSDFLDWKTYDGVGVDAEAYLITGQITGGDPGVDKQVPCLITHMVRTENGFETDGTGDLVPTNQSSCKVQARWEWANSATSNRWGREFQAYQYKRHYIPEDALDPYDYGFETIVTRRKLRGKGKSLSVKFSSEPGKDLRLLGWGMDFLVERRR